jgi:antitoxin component YwqK of YwqJK toxin-antitoxin module
MYRNHIETKKPGLVIDLTKKKDIVLNTEQLKELTRQVYTPFTEIDESWHPVVIAECRKINSEKSKLN